MAHANVLVKLPFSYEIIDNPEASEVILLLHGYSQSASYILHKLKKALPPKGKIIAANGLFPVPEKVSDGYKEGYAWYFYKTDEDRYVIDMKPAVEMWKKIVEETKIEKLPKRIVGYSQGGYLAPFLAQALLNVKQTIGIACQFLDEEMEQPLPLRLDAIHDVNDEVVDYENSRRSHEALKKQGVRGEFIAVKGEGHRITPPLVNALGKLLSISLEKL